MKKSLAFLALGVIAVSCSPDNDGGGGNSSENFLPSNDGNYWTYNVTGSEEGSSGRDSVYVANDTVIASETFKKMKARDPRFGFYANSVHQSAMRKSGSKILITGSNNLSFGEQLPVDLTITDFVFFDANASANAELDSKSGTMTQDLDGIPVTIDYEVRTVAGSHQDTYLASDGTTYSDVISSKFIVSLKVSANLEGIPFPIVILDTQDVIKSTSYYAAGIGVVATQTTAHYELQDFSAIGIELPIPQTATSTTTEVLDTYSVTP